MKRNNKLITTMIITTILLSSCSALGIKSNPTSTPIPTVEASGGVISQGNLVPKEHMYLSFPVGGHVSQVLVKQGDQVTAGQVLVSLGDSEQYQASVTSATLEVQNAQQALNDINSNADISSSNAWLSLLDANSTIIQAESEWTKIDTDEYQKKIDDAELKVSDMQTALDDAQTAFDKLANLTVDNPTRKTAETDLKNARLDYENAVHERDQLTIARDRAQANLQLAKAVQVKAQHDYDATRQGPNPDQLTLAQMNLDTAQAHLTAAKAALHNLDLKAPFTGSVVDVNVSNGQLVGSDTWAVLVADFSEWYVDSSDLTEQEVVNVSIGQKATVSADALPDQHLSSQVTEIANMYNTQSGDVLYRVRLRVDRPDPAFKWGMTVEIAFNP